MNKVILMGRLTRDPSIRYTQANSAQESTCVGRYSLAVDRRFNRDGERKADFISCVAFYVESFTMNELAHMAKSGELVKR